MTNEHYLEVAKECGACTLQQPNEELPYSISFGPEELDAYTARILAEKLAQSPKEIERLNALVAMQAEALKVAADEFMGLPHSLGYDITHVPKLNQALSTSQESIAAWEAEKLLPLQQKLAGSENMVALQAEAIAGLLKRVDEIEPLQRQVATLDEFVNHCLNAVDNLNDLPISDEWATKWANKASDMLEKHNWYRAEKETAEAYDREHAAKALEEVDSDDLQKELAKRNFVSMPKNVYELLREHLNVREDAIRWCEGDMIFPCATKQVKEWKRD